MIRWTLVGWMSAWMALGAYGQEPVDTLIQVSSLDALMSGAYDGVMTFDDLRKFGSAGIGTFDRLDGEMIMLDGVVYQMKSDGSVVCPDDSMTTPFASVCFFRAEERAITSNRMDYSECKSWLDQWAPLQNSLVVFKIEGMFPRMKIRVVPGQEKPYPPLSEVAKTQPEFEFTNQPGTLLGLRCPAYMGGVNMAGYHFHFLSTDKQHGGHVLAFEMNPGGQCEANVFEQFLMKNAPQGGGLIQDQGISRDQFDTLIQQVE